MGIKNITIKTLLPMENKLHDEGPKMTVGGLNCGKDITYIPFRFLDERQAHSNHGQSLQRLNERGGLGYSEVMDIITGKPWATFHSSGRTEEQAAETVKLWLKKKYAAETPSSPIDAGRGEVRTSVGWEPNADSMRSQCKSTPALTASPAEKEAEEWGDDALTSLIDYAVVTFDRYKGEVPLLAKTILDSYRAKTKNPS